MHSLETLLTGLAERQKPSKTAQERVWQRVKSRVEPQAIVDKVDSMVPSESFRQRVRSRVLSAGWLSSGLQTLAGAQDVSMARKAVMRQSLLQRLAPRHFSFMDFGIKWTAAFAAFLLAVRMMPVVLLAPATQAETSVQLIPSGDVWVSVGGVSTQVSAPQVIKGPALISTGANSQATIILNDDGVLRLAGGTVLRLHDVGDRPQFASVGPTATLVGGQVWMLGLLPPTFPTLSLETTRGTVEVNAGSVSVSDDGSSITAAVFDRGAAFHTGENKRLFLISGERVIQKRTGALYVNDMPQVLFTTSWVNVNLDQDAVHRADIAKLQQDRREKMAGILPTSFLYPAKRIAEEVDVLFTLGSDAKAEKRVRQADTRLSEAMTLLQNGENDEAAESLTEYRDTLVALASGTGDNLVQFLVRKQIDDLSTSVTVATADSQLAAVQQAVLDVSAALPNADLKPRDIEGYVLVDKLAALNNSLVTSRNLTGAVVAYQEIQPYLKTLLAEDSDVHPLLQREAKSLLVSTASLMGQLQVEQRVVAMEGVAADIAQYLPPEPENILLSESELNAQVQAIVDRIFALKLPRSRYNELMNAMRDLEGNPNRGTILRRLYRALPENGLAGYVRTEIKELGDELNDE
jgi:hypothetical protein